MPTFQYLQVQPGRFDLDLCYSFIMFMVPKDETEFLKEELRSQAQLLLNFQSFPALSDRRKVCTVNLLRRYLGMQKVAPVVEKVTEFLNKNPSEKVVLFALNKDTILSLKRELSDFGAVHIYCGTNFENIDRRIKKFNESKWCRVLVITTRPDKKLRILVNHVFFVEPDWTWKLNVVAIKTCRPLETLTVTFVSIADNLESNIVKKIGTKVESAFRKKAPDPLECPR